MFLESKGLQLGEIVKVRYQNGVPFVKVRILRWCTPEQDFISNWARVVLPFGTYNYGTWATPVVGEKVWVAFEGGDPQRPVVIGYAPVKHDPIEMPPEFGNDSPHDKSKPGDREDPPENYPKPVHAWLAKTKLGHFFLLHDKLKRVVIRGEEKIEIGELAKHNVLLGDLFQEVYNNHTHQDSVPPPGEGERITDRELSQMVFVVHDKSEQPPQSEIKEIVLKMQKVGEALGGGSGGGENAFDVVKDIAEEVGFSDDQIEQAEKIFNDISESVKKGLRDVVKSATGIEIDISRPWDEILRDVAEQLGVDKALNAFLNELGEALKTFLPEEVVDQFLSLLNSCIEGNYARFADQLVEGIVDFLSNYLPEDLQDAVTSFLIAIFHNDPQGLLGALKDLLGNLIPGDLVEALLSGDWAAIAEALAPVLKNLLGQFLPEGVLDGLVDFVNFITTGDFSSLVEAGGEMLKGALASALMGMGIPAPVADGIVDAAVAALSGQDIGSIAEGFISDALESMGIDGLAISAGALLGSFGAEFLANIGGAELRASLRW